MHPPSSSATVADKSLAKARRAYCSGIEAHGADVSFAIGTSGAIFNAVPFSSEQVSEQVVPFGNTERNLPVGSFSSACAE